MEDQSEHENSILTKPPEPMENSTFTSSNNNCAYQRLEHPTLDLDVYITEDHVEKMFVYKDDSPKHLADEFSKKFNLSKEKRDVLIQVIKNQIEKVLTCISEEDEETE